MKIRRFGYRFAILTAVALLCFPPRSAMAADAKASPAVIASPADLELFEKKIRPILVEKCQQCHGVTKQKGGLRLDSHSALLYGNESGPVVTPGKPADSLLVEAVQYTGDYKMPPSGKLPEAEIAALTDWIRRGAPWPQETGTAATSSAARPAPFDLEGRRKRQWALQPVRKPELPQVARRDWGQSAIDRFILRRLEDASLSPAPAADRRTLLRRVTFDLIGLPPTPAEIEAFLQDHEPGAFERIVDRLLASPHYGERWARHWLDLVRYAETYGHEFDFEIPYAFEYRDYVIRALNADVPYNQFVTEHIAGDLLPNPRRNPDPKNPFNESIIGTGFFFLGEAKHSPVDLRADEDERIDNQIDVLGKTFLGMTLGCARCHDHKFDAISARDYYALAGYLQSSRYQIACIDSPEQRRETVAELTRLQAERERLERTALQASSQTTKVRNPDVARYLLAAVEALRKPARQSEIPKWIVIPRGSENQDFIPQIAAPQPPPDPNLVRWVACLRKAEKSPGDLFAPWANWAMQPGRSFDEFRRDELTRVEANRRKAKELRRSSVVFEDFSRPDYSDWFVTGEAFGSGPRRGIAASVVLSPRLQGALRSRTFVIEKPWMHIRANGRNARIRLVVDGLQLIQNPLYGSFQTSFGSQGKQEMQWHRQSVVKAMGHRAYLELLDDGEGELSVDEIVFSDQPESPRDVEATWATLLERPDVRTPEDWAAACAETLIRATDPEATESIPSNSKGLQRPIANALRSRAWDWLLEQNRDGWSPSGTGPANPGIVAQLKTLDRRRAELEGKVHYRRKAITLGDGTAEDDAVHLRGNYKFAGEIVPRRFVEALGGTRFPAPSEGSGRLELARQMVSIDNPLTARVFVNRVWKQHFGEGLVRTPDDFGNMGRPPTHPELLDYLASEFMRDGWSLKKLHRKLLLSSTYQMSSRPDDVKAEQLDPQNLLLHRMPIRRLEAEAIRDAMLAVSGRLDLQMFGPAVTPHLTPFMEGRGRPAQSGPLDGAGRRTIYLGIRRNFLNPLLLAFDSPVPFATIGRRNVTNVPAQALALLNNPFVIQQSQQWARRTATEKKAPAERIADMYVAAYGRPPTASEQAEALAFVSQNPSTDESDPQQAWTDLAHVLLNVKEFIFVN